MISATILVLDAMPGTPEELLKKTGLARPILTRTIEELHDEGKCFIRRWTKDYRPYYAAGLHADARHPKGADKRNTEGKEYVGIRKAACAMADRVSKMRDPLLWFLFDKETVL